MSLFAKLSLFWVLILKAASHVSGMGPQNQLKLDNYEDKESKQVMTGEYDDELVRDNNWTQRHKTRWKYFLIQNWLAKENIAYIIGRLFFIRSKTTIFFCFLSCAGWLWILKLSRPMQVAPDMSLGVNQWF